MSRAEHLGGLENLDAQRATCTGARQSAKALVLQIDNDGATVLRRNSGGSSCEGDAAR